VGFRILIIDDEPTLRESLKFALAASGYEVSAARTGEEGLELLSAANPDLILLDHWLPGINGDQVLSKVKEINPDLPVIIMTAQGSVELAVSLMKMGAFDFLVKPFELDQIEALVAKGLERARLQREVEWLRAQYQEKFRAGGIIGTSVQMKEILRLAEKIAQGADTTVLIEGETGTGKELLAEYIHSLSPRSPFPFIPINCGAFPQDLLESELFGYDKGAFTGASEKGKIGKVEAAEKGTLFLDEVGELPPPAQVKVLRLLESKEYFRLGGVEKKKADVRILAATNKDLEAEIKKKNFRDDLFFRLNVVRLIIPPPARSQRGYPGPFSIFYGPVQRPVPKRVPAVDPGGGRTHSCLSLAGECSRTAQCGGKNRPAGTRGKDPGKASFFPGRPPGRGLSASRLPGDFDSPARNHSG